ncbi:MAG TPA: hypothetical protein VMW35_04545 [Myxococcota bacterium]|nr:hypothetical protein [Myxococcota bacterium]
MGLAAAWLGAVAVTAAAHAAIPLPSPADIDVRFVPKPELARGAAFGFDALVGDAYWLEAVQIVGAEVHRDPSAHAAVLARLVDVITTLDPFVGHPYRFAAVWLVDSIESVRAADRLLERGIAYHPRDWRNRFYLAFNQFFYLQDEQAAADSLAPAANLPDAPRYLGRLAARLRAGSGGLDASAAFLRELARNELDPAAQAGYAEALDEVETERVARVLDAARREFQRREGRDIERVEDLARGASPVLRSLPPEPHGERWVIDGEGTIVSSYLGRRYVAHVHPAWKEKRERWRAQLDAEREGEGR